MKKLKGAYIFCSQGCDWREHRAVIEAPRIKMWLICVNDPKEGVDVAKKLVDENGIQIIELCGEWGYAGASKVQEAVGENVPVGIVLQQVRNALALVDILYRKK